MRAWKLGTLIEGPRAFGPLGKALLARFMPPYVLRQAPGPTLSRRLRHDYNIVLDLERERRLADPPQPVKSNGRIESHGIKGTNDQAFTRIKPER